jgi:hypothetical protein
MNTNAPVRGMLAVALGSLALAACDRPGNANTAASDNASVGQKVDRALAQTKEGLTRAGENVKPTLERAGEKIKEAAASDAAITTSIKADYLKDPDLSVFKIDVDTQDGVVTLNGVTETAAARMRAEKLAQANKGVREVRNHLTVKQG